MAICFDPTENVRYLGVYIDNFLSWDFHISQLSNKLSRANGILSKLRHFTTKEILLSHMIYGCLVWSLATTKNMDSIIVLQKNCFGDFFLFPSFFFFHLFSFLPSAYFFGFFLSASFPHHFLIFIMLLWMILDYAVIFQHLSCKVILLIFSHVKPLLFYKK